MKTNKFISIFLVIVMFVNFGMILPVYGESKPDDNSKMRFNREVIGGIIGELVTEIIGTIIVAKITLSGPNVDEYGIGNWLTFSTLFYLSSIFILIPVGSFSGVTIAGRLNGYESDWGKTLQGSYDGIGQGLGVIPIVLITCPLNAAKKFDKYAKLISNLETREGESLRISE